MTERKAKRILEAAIREGRSLELLNRIHEGYIPKLSEGGNLLLIKEEELWMTL